MKSTATRTKENKIDKALISSLLDYLIQEDKLDSANSVLNYLLDLYPNDFWLLTKQGSVYHEMKNYKKALEFSKKALKLAPDSPLVLWDHACNLDMLGKEKEAIAAWNKIISFGVTEIAFKKTKEGKRWAESIVNDSLLRIAVSYLEIGDKNLALEYLKKYFLNRRLGMPSSYSEKETRDMIRSISRKELHELDFAA
jgi:tetratricopeptide (TPR) repeat protein